MSDRVSSLKLKSCPFCGGAAILTRFKVEGIEVSPWMGRVQCVECGANVSSGFSANQKEAERKASTKWENRK